MKSDLSHLKLCLPIIQASVADVLDDITAASKDYQIIEIWLDYVEDLRKETVATLLQPITRAIPLLLFRRQKLETIRMPLELRCDIMRELPVTAWLDLDVRHQREEINWCREHRPDLSLVISYHNYDETPSDTELRSIVAEMDQAGATIFKFSTFCQSRHDALRLMSLLLELKEQGRRTTVLGMGEQGKATRIIGPLWGSEIAYAPQDVANSSAPGQLSLKQLSAIFKEL